MGEAKKKGDVEKATTTKKKDDKKKKAAELVETAEALVDEEDFVNSLAERATKIKRIGRSLGAAGLKGAYERSDKLQLIGNSLSDSDKAVLFNEDLGDEVKKALETTAAPKTTEAKKKGDVEKATTTKKKDEKKKKDKKK